MDSLAGSPMLGEPPRWIEGADEVDTVVQYPHDVPCTFTREDGTRWRTERADAFEFGDDARVYVVTSLDRPDSFNYEVVIAADDVALLAVLNTREPNRELFDDLVQIAWSKAVDEGVVSQR